MSGKSIAAGFASVVSCGVLLMPLLVQPDPVSAAPPAMPIARIIAGVLPYEGCGQSASGEAASRRGSGNSAAMAPDDRGERPCPREPVRFAQQGRAMPR